MVHATEQNSEADWVVQAQAGDQEAFGQLVDRYQRLVISVAYRQGLDLQDAENVAQEAFVKAWLALHSYRPAAGSWRAWLCRIALNLAIDTQRRERPTSALDDRWPDGRRGPQERAEADLDAETVRRALAQLPPASRAALILKEYEGLSYAEIATALNIPLGTVMSRLHYARGRLRELLLAGGQAGGANADDAAGRDGGGQDVAGQVVTRDVIAEAVGEPA